MLVVLDNFKEVSVTSCCVLLYVFQGNILFFIYLSPSQYVMISKIIHENNNSKCKIFKKKNPINTLGDTVRSMCSLIVHKKINTFGVL